MQRATSEGSRPARSRTRRLRARASGAALIAALLGLHHLLPAIAAAANLSVPTPSGDETPAGGVPEPPEPSGRPDATGPPDGVEEIVVRERAARTGPPLHATGSKLGVPLADLAATVNLLDGDELRLRGATDLNTALGYVAGVTPVFRYGGFQFMTVRGFSEFVVLNDGVRDDRSTIVNSAPQSGLWDLERIEVLKGPSAVLYGYGAIGGVANAIRRRPLAEPAAGFDLGIGSADDRRAAVSLTGPLWGETLLARFDAGFTESEDFRGAEMRRAGGTLSLGWRPHPRHLLDLRLSRDDDVYDTDAGLPTANGRVPDGVDRKSRFNTPQDELDYESWDLGLDYRFEIDETFTLTERFSTKRDDYEYFSTEFLDVSASGDQVERGYFYFFRHWRPVWNQVELRADFGFGVPHRALVGHEWSYLSGWSDRSNVGALSVAPRDLFDPGSDPQPAVAVPKTREDVIRQWLHSVYAFDRVELREDLTLSLGVRGDFWKRLDRRDLYDPVTGSRIQRGDVRRREDDVLTYNAGLVYRPGQRHALYASYATGFRPSTAVPEDERQLDPEFGRQIELGYRVDLGDRLHASLAVFDIEKRDVTISRGGGRFSQAGKLTSRGVEIDAEARPLDRLRLRAGYAYTDAEFDDFEQGGVDLSGRRPRFVPAHTAVLFAGYALPFDLNLGLGARWRSRSFGDVGNDVELPDHWLVDLTLDYTIGPLRFALSVSNLLDEDEYLVSAINDTQVTPGPPREVLFQVQYSFEEAGGRGRP